MENVNRKDMRDKLIMKSLCADSGELRIVIGHPALKQIESHFNITKIILPSNFSFCLSDEDFPSQGQPIFMLATPHIYRKYFCGNRCSFCKCPRLIGKTMLDGMR